MADDPSDETLLLRFARGEARAMDALVRRHGGAVYSFVRRFLGDHDPQVEDVTQEVWLRVLRGHASFDGRSRFSTWLFSVTRNACTDALRRRLRRPQAPSSLAPAVEALPDPGPEVPERVSRRELEARLARAAEELPDELREVFLLREQTDLTFTEIAEALGVPRETVKSRMRYALERIKRALGREAGAGGGAPAGGPGRGEASRGL